MNDEFYWTTFCFENIDPVTLHCTHKFLGTQTTNAIVDIMNMMDNYFKKNVVHQFSLAFIKEAYFGNNGKSVRVLTANPLHIPISFKAMRLYLDRYRIDDFDYTPHVTTEAREYITDWRFDRYALMRGKEQIKEWKFQSPYAVVWPR